MDNQIHDKICRFGTQNSISVRNIFNAMQVLFQMYCPVANPEQPNHHTQEIKFIAGTLFAPRLAHTPAAGMLRNHTQMHTEFNTSSFYGTKYTKGALQLTSPRSSALASSGSTMKSPAQMHHVLQYLVTARLLKPSFPSNQPLLS